MAIFLDEKCICDLVMMQDALDAVEEVFREQVQYESTDLAEPVKVGLLKWKNVFNLADVVSGRVPGRRLAGTSCRRRYLDRRRRIGIGGTRQKNDRERAFQRMHASFLLVGALRLSQALMHKMHSSSTSR